MLIKILFLMMPLSKLARMFLFTNITKDFYVSFSLPFWERIRENKVECNVYSDHTNRISQLEYDKRERFCLLQ